MNSLLTLKSNSLGQSDKCNECRAETEDPLACGTDFLHLHDFAYSLFSIQKKYHILPEEYEI